MFALDKAQRVFGFRNRVRALEILHKFGDTGSCAFGMIPHSLEAC
jgi:hypothetical protein